MNISQVIQVAWQNLQANKKNALQAMLLVMIGVAGVVAIMSVSQVIVNRLAKISDDYTSNLFCYCFYKREDSNKSFSPADMEALARKYPELISGISPVLQVEGGVKYGDKVLEKFSCNGVDEEFIDLVSVLEIAQGRWLQHMDVTRRQNVCVLGSYVAREVNGGEALGQTLRIGGEDYLVVGVLQAIDRYEHEDDWNSQIFIPYTKTNEVLLPNIWNEHTGGYWSNYFIKAADEGSMRGAVRALKDMLDERLGKDYVVYVINFASSLEQAIQGFWGAIIPMVLGAFVVMMLGGVGIMNIMVTAVMERAREIGIRKAFGATCEDIRRQFMLEAVIISLTGGVIGVVVGEGIAVCVLQYFKNTGIVVDVDTLAINFAWLDVILNIWPVILALGFAVAVGVICGTYPAQQAAKMEIVDAINSD